MKKDFLSVFASCGDIQIKQNEGLAKYSTFGKAKYALFPENKNALIFAVKACREFGMPYRIIGCGSNVLFDDEGFSGVIIFTKQINRTEVRGNLLYAECGLPLTALCTLARSTSLAGLEFAFGIPGSVGGAVFMNAGAYGSEMKDIVISAEYLDENGKIRTIGREAMELSYRHSFFSDSSCVIISVTMQLEDGDPETIKNAMNECMAKRSAKQPLEYPSAGSTFKRPEGSYASLLIDQCGLKGKQCGGAMVSEKHSGFIINKGYATCADVLELCSQVQRIVKEKTGYTLELEPVILR